jgi:hypothetical protein
MTMVLATPRTGLNLSRMWRDAPALTGVAALLAFAMIPLFFALALDDRLFQGELVWIKPLKFHAALVIYLITLAFFARYVAPTTRKSRLWRGYVAAVCIAILGEIAWIGGAASFQTASHFSIVNPWMTAVYGLMGAFAVLLTSASLVMGIAIWCNRDARLPSALHLSVVLGLITTFALTVIVAGYMSSTLSHFVGISTRSIAVLGWSRDAGDFRVAHFFATHALHAVPLLGVSTIRLSPVQGRTVVITGTIAYSVFVLALFAQALSGQPFLPALG